MHGYTLDMSKKVEGEPETSWFSFVVGDDNDSIGKQKGTLRICDSADGQNGKVLGKVEVKEEGTFTMESGEIESSSGEGIANEGTTSVSGGNSTGSVSGGGSSSGSNTTGGNTNGAGSAAQITTKTETKEDGSAVTKTETKKTDGSAVSRGFT